MPYLRSVLMVLAGRPWTSDMTLPWRCCTARRPVAASSTLAYPGFVVGGVFPPKSTQEIPDNPGRQLLHRLAEFARPRRVDEAPPVRQGRVTRRLIERQQRRRLYSGVPAERLRHGIGRGTPQRP